MANYIIHLEEYKTIIVEREDDVMDPPPQPLVEGEDDVKDPPPQPLVE